MLAGLAGTLLHLSHFHAIVPCMRMHTIHFKQTLLWAYLEWQLFPTALKTNTSLHLFTQIQWCSSLLYMHADLPKRAGTASFWLPGIAEPASNKFLPIDIIPRETKSTSLGLYAVQMKGRKLGFDQFQLTFPFVIQWIYIIFFYISTFLFCFAPVGFCCNTWLMVIFSFGQEEGQETLNSAV